MARLLLCVTCVWPLFEHCGWVGGWEGANKGETVQCKCVEEENQGASTTRCDTWPGAYKLHKTVDCLALINGIKARGVQEAPLRPSEWPVQQEQIVQATSIAMSV
jgi:hypothetical protein